jgi:hypothetical protein
MSGLGPEIRRYATERVFAAREVHYLSGSRDYDADVVSEIVFTIEAGLSFFHTHGEGMGLVLLFGATLVASFVRPGRLRRALHWLLGLSALFPVGYLAYSAFILVLGRDRGSALAERLFLIPFGSAAILGLGALAGVVAFLFIASRAAPVSLPASESAPLDEASPARVQSWRRPPLAVVLTAALLIALAEIGGAAMGRFKSEVDAFVSARVRERPELHGLVGTPDVDGEILDEVRTKVDAALRLFHLHGEGTGLMVLAGALVVAAYVRRAWLRRALHASLTVGGLGFPLGYLVWAALTPFRGVDAARAAAAGTVLVPFGGLLILALWALPFLPARHLGGRRRGRDAGEMAQDRLRLPPLSVVLPAILLLVLAEVGGGAMVKFKVDLERARRGQAEARPLVHGLVGVRQIDGPVIDTLLARADFALRLFHLHGEGMALVMVGGGVIVGNFVSSRLLAGIVQVLLSVGGFLYPFGYLAWALMIPILGPQPARDLAEVFFWIPFGGAALVAMSVTVLALAGELLLAGGVSPGDR